MADDSSFFASFSFRAAFMKSCGTSKVCLFSEVAKMQASSLMVSNSHRHALQPAEMSCNACRALADVFQ